MEKIINPCRCDVHRNTTANAFVKIIFDDRRLSISGVVGPTRDGNCKGSCGQCIDEIRKGTPGDIWTDEMLQKFCDIWEEWHLNDMRPYCEHQKELGWNELSKKKVTMYHYTLRRQALCKKREAKKKAAIDALKAGTPFHPTKEQTMFSTIEYTLVSHKELSGEIAKYYEPARTNYIGGYGATEEKELGWLGKEEHPEGILSKPCPVCGYKYGTKWMEEKVPEEIIAWLFSLPDTKKEPAWV